MQGDATGAARAPCQDCVVVQHTSCGSRAFGLLALNYQSKPRYYCRVMVRFCSGSWVSISRGKQIAVRQQVFGIEIDNAIEKRDLLGAIGAARAVTIHEHL